MFNIRQLRHLRLVIETGSFAEAARKAYITQPALSNSIRALEEQVGMQLIDRSRRPARITSEGKDLYTRIDSLLSEAHNLEKEITYLAQGMTGHLNIGMTAVASTCYGGMILGNWHTENPGMSIDVAIADNITLVERLRAEKLDLIIVDPRELPGSLTDLDTVPIPAQPGGGFCRTGHPLLDQTEITFADLLPYRFVGSHLPVALMDMVAKNLGLDDPKAIRFALDCDNISVLKDTIIHSDLILLTARGCVRNEMTTGLIKELPIQFGVNAIWTSATLKHTVLHPAIPGLRVAIEKALLPSI